MSQFSIFSFKQYTYIHIQGLILVGPACKSDFEYAGEKIFFLLPSEFWAETLVIKDEEETNKQKFLNMYTSCIHGRYPRKISPQMVQATPPP